MEQVVLTSASRTGLGDFGGALKALSVAELARLVMEHVIESIGELSIVEKVIFGNCFSPLEQNVARVLQLIRPAFPNMSPDLASTAPVDLPCRR